VSSSPTDIKNATLGAVIEQPPMEILIEQADRFFIFPYAAMNNLALVQTGRMKHY
jgi:hypothetical protein